MRDGVAVSTRLISATDFSQLVREMVGRELNDRFPPRTSDLGPEVLRVEKLSLPGRFQDISFKVNAGEILGVAGLMGAGRSEIMRAVFGLDNYTSGQVWVNGTPVTIRHPLQAIKHGIGFITENRRDEGLVLDFSISDNIGLPNTAAFSACGIINKVRERNFVLKLTTQLGVKMSSVDLPVKQLSGGNQQKVVVAKWV